jgi:uncharacterized membrane protein YgcG
MSFKIGNVFHDGDAPTIDKAIAGSVIAHYVSGALQTLAGHFETAEPNQFAAWYKNWGESKLPVEDVPGFTNRNDKKKPIKLRLFGTLTSISVNKTLKGATFESAVHETIHLNSNPNRSFAKNFGDVYNEGVTEYFALKVFGVATGAAYPNELTLASGLIKAFGESSVANAYFKDDAHALLTQIQQRFLRASGNLKNFLVWQTKSKQSDNPQNWTDADKLLQAAASSPAGGSSGAGSGSGSGSGSGGGSASAGSASRS